ncbi:MAG: aminotransferase class I/II-fold pyridoxal phosphate-dependent enzyme [Gammaproteobacteria bacterium]|jgi:methionine aminotransferase|nr:aminotransferase class I/II-fold pyridoxal phosphate-dependent enzyme [Gammaproteobacteria bacterium]
MTPHSKLPDVGTTVFTVMSALAAEHGAINLSQGFPDFEPPGFLLDRVAHHLRHRRNQYAPMTGVPALGAAVAGKIGELYGVEVDPGAEVTVTSGATEALFCAIHAVVRPGDEVIVFDPAYDAYEPAVRLAGGRTVHLPLAAPDFSLPWAALEQALTARTRLVIVNSPHNPTGAVLAAQDLARLGGLLAGRDCFVLSDEVYEHIVFDGAAHASVLAEPSLRERSVAVFSFGKTYHATGWKVGYAVAPPALTGEFRKVHQFVTFSTSTPMQWALADMLREHPEHHRELSAFYQARRDRFRGMLAPSRFELLPCAGTYFQLADYGALSDEPDTAFARRLTTEHGVAVIPVSVFYDSPPEARLVRFCFAKEEETLARAAEVLCRI